MKAAFFVVLAIFFLASSAQGASLNYGNIAGSPLAQASPIIVEKETVQYDRSGGWDFVSIGRHSCPPGRTRDVFVSVKDLLAVIELGGTMYFDPWASIVTAITEQGNQYRIYVAVKTINDYVLGCDPQCPGCNFCDPCNGSPDDPNCRDRLRATLEVVKLCR